jgi:Uma2 family endonuclease
MGWFGRLKEVRRGSQVVRQRSAKPLLGGSIPPRASNQCMAAAISQPPLKTWTRPELEALDAAGLLAGTRFELIEGQIFDKIGQNPRHAAALSRLAAFLGDMFGNRRIRTQLPVEPAKPDAPRSLPEPDLAVTREIDTSYDSRHPEAADVVLIAEVTDTTYEYDTKRKAKLYARAGFQEYIILDLNDRELLVYQSPKGGVYTSIHVFREGDMYSPMAAPNKSVNVSELLPASRSQHLE